MKRIVNAARKIGEEAARDAEHRLDGVGHRCRDRVRARLDVLRRAGVADGVELSGVAEILHRRRQVLEVVPHPADQRHEEAAGRAR